MSVVYRCNGCNEVVDTVAIRGSIPVLSSAVHVDWAIAPDPATGVERHLCDKCLREAMREVGKKW